MQRILRTAIAALASVALASAVTRGPDGYGYTATNLNTYSFQNISGTGARILAGSDDGVATLALPFSFQFYGTTYTSLCVSVNGLISFGGCNPSFNNVDLTIAAPTGDLPTIAPFWVDLTFNKSGADALYYQTAGTAPNRQFIVQWNNAYAQSGSSGITFEVVLSESDNSVLMQYQNVIGGAAIVDSGNGATVGIRTTGGNGNGKVLQWSFKAPVLQNRTSIRFAPPASSGGATDVTSAFRVVSSGLLYNKTTLLYTGTVTLTNATNAAVLKPLEVVFTGLTSGVSLTSKSGTTANGPYQTVAGPGSVAAGQSVTLNVAFSNPTGVRIGYKLFIYSGGF